MALLLIVSDVFVAAPVVSRRMLAPLTVVSPVIVVLPVMSMRSVDALPRIVLPLTCRSPSVMMLPADAFIVMFEAPAAPILTLPLKPAAPLTSSASSINTAPPLSALASVIVPDDEMLRPDDESEKLPVVLIATASASPLPMFAAPLRLVVPETVKLFAAEILPVTSTAEPRSVRTLAVLPIVVLPEAVLSELINTSAVPSMDTVPGSTKMSPLAAPLIAVA